MKKRMWDWFLKVFCRRTPHEPIKSERNHAPENEKTHKSIVKRWWNKR